MKGSIASYRKERRWLRLLYRYLIGLKRCIFKEKRNGLRDISQAVGNITVQPIWEENKKIWQVTGKLVCPTENGKRVKILWPTGKI